MLLKWIHFAILVHLILVDASKHATEVDSDEDNKSKSSCIDGQCFLTSKKNEQLFPDEVSTNQPTEETTTHKQDDEFQPDGFDLVKLISLLSSNKNDGGTKISFKVRDILSGFHNTGSKYHVGNVHKERNRDRRDTESVLEDTATDIAGKTDLTLTTETTTNYAQTEDSSKEFGKQSTTENYLTNNDNKSVNVNVVYAEADSFQDSNVTDINDSVSNDSTLESVDFKINLNNSNEQGVNNDFSNSNSKNETVLLVDNNSNNFLNVADKETVVDENLRSQTNQTVKIALSSKDLNSIQNALSNDLGIKTKGANPVVNFSLNGPLDNKKDKPVIVIVYNCSCGNTDTHTHDNAIEKEVTANDYIDAKNVLNTRLILSNDEPVFSSIQTEVAPEVKLMDNTVKVYDTVNDKTNNAFVENDLLRKRNSLLALQKANKAKEAFDTILDSLGEENQSNLETLKLSFGINPQNIQNFNDNKSNDFSNSDSLIIAENVDSSETENRSDNSNNDVTVQKTPSENALNNLQLANIAADVNQAFSLDSKNLNTEDLNLDTVVKGTLLSERKRRSIIDAINSLPTEKTIHRDKRGVADVINELFQYFMIVPDISTDDSAVKSNVQPNEKVIHEKKHTQHKTNSQTNTKVIKESNHGERIKRNSLNSHRNTRSEKNILDYVQKQFEPNHFADDHKYLKEKSSDKNREFKLTRHPKYYDYTNDRMNLLEPDSSSNGNDGTVVNFKSLNDDAALPDDNNYLEAVKFVLNEESLPSQNKDISSKTLLRLKPLYVNVYLQSLMNNFEKYQHENEQ